MALSQDDGLCVACASRTTASPLHDEEDIGVRDEGIFKNSAVCEIHVWEREMHSKLSHTSRGGYDRMDDDRHHYGGGYSSSNNACDDEVSHFYSAKTGYGDDDDDLTNYYYC
ncbi:hypothetical protein EC988_008652 [Linderina pennispora]|nr:hypothetical protein EC988_008652 [Linderina pennispora]